ncbi:MAG: hypothetical protein LBH44_03675 [Treponema sp.]|nr:hypothetical protein [Treponema sp.]
MTPFFVYRGWCYTKIGDYGEALVDAVMALELDPSYEGALELRCDMRAKLAAR